MTGAHLALGALRSPPSCGAALRGSERPWRSRRPPSRAWPRDAVVILRRSPTAARANVRAAPRAGCGAHEACAIMSDSSPARGASFSTPRPRLEVDARRPTSDCGDTLARRGPPRRPALAPRAPTIATRAPGAQRGAEARRRAARARARRGRRAPRRRRLAPTCGRQRQARARARTRPRSCLFFSCRADLLCVSRASRRRASPALLTRDRSRRLRRGAAPPARAARTAGRPLETRRRRGNKRHLPRTSEITRHALVAHDRRPPRLGSARRRRHRIAEGGHGHVDKLARSARATSLARRRATACLRRAARERALRALQPPAARRSS